jgi:phage tail sheath gpL-like
MWESSQRFGRTIQTSLLKLHACRRFSLIYVLKDSITSQFEGHGLHRMTAGDAWLQPKNINHKLLDYSHDCEVLEIVMPVTGGAIFPGSLAS